MCSQEHQRFESSLLRHLVRVSDANRELEGIIKDWIVYILECSDGTYYTGITNDLDKRMRIHNSGKGARYTSRRIPVKCVYQQNGLTQRKARQEEIILKDWSKKKKIKLIEGVFERSSRLRSK